MVLDSIHIMSSCNIKVMWLCHLCDENTSDELLRCGVWSFHHFDKPVTHKGHKARHCTHNWLLLRELKQCCYMFRYQCRHFVCINCTSQYLLKNLERGIDLFSVCSEQAMQHNTLTEIHACHPWFLYRTCGWLAFEYEWPWRTISLFRL